MTVTFYSATLVDGDGRNFHGSISWDKYTPKQLKATLCPHLSESEVDYPEWTRSSTHSRSGLETLILKMKAEAEKMELTLVTEAETKFAIK